jgi:malonyl-CoA decarboxylase
MIRRFARSILDSIADAGEKILDLKPSGTSLKTLVSLCQDLVSHKGVASGIALAREVVQQYESLQQKDKLSFFIELNQRLGPDLGMIQEAARHFDSSPDQQRLAALAKTMAPSRQKLFTRMNMAPNGTASIVSMREDLLGFLRENPELTPLDDDFRHLLTSWFNPGFLTLKSIDWDTEASVLEKIIEYETVHNIEDWKDLKQRLVEDRRCFAYFHPALEDEPLIFVEVALMKGMPGSIQKVIDSAHKDPDDADTAVFYSINNCQKGLRQIPLGNFLIKRVVHEIARDLPSIKTYCTLSPVTGFSRWLEKELGRDDSALPVREKETLLLLNEPYWNYDAQKTEMLKKPLMKTCANYLANVKKRSDPINAVARFHFGNGASLHRINWMGNASQNGIEEYCGIMVNYLYDLKSIESNHEAYIESGKLALSKSVKSLLNS